MDHKINEDSNLSSLSISIQQKNTEKTAEVVQKKPTQQKYKRKREDVKHNHANANSKNITTGRIKEKKTKKSRAVIGKIKRNNSKKMPLRPSGKRRKRKRLLLVIGIFGYAIGTTIGIFLGNIIDDYISRLINAGPEVCLNDFVIEKGIESRKLQITVETTNDEKVSLAQGTDIDNKKWYLYCEGNEKIPGAVDLTLALKNTSEYKMTLGKIEVKKLDYTPVSNEQSRAPKSGKVDKKTGNMKQAASYYCLIDPMVQDVEVYPVDNSIDIEGIQAMEYEKQKPVESILPSESQKCNLKLSFTDYGIYRLQVRIRYYRNGKYLYSESKPDIRILYERNSK